jgi:hypothetical protein
MTPSWSPCQTKNSYGQGPSRPSVVTENARDFGRIIRAWALTEERHASVIFTSPRRYHRGSDSYPANLVNALGQLMAQPPDQDLNWVSWLPEGSPMRRVRAIADHTERSAHASAGLGLAFGRGVGNPLLADLDREVFERQGCLQLR